MLASWHNSTAIEAWASATAVYNASHQARLAMSPLLSCLVTNIVWVFTCCSVGTLANAKEVLDAARQKGLLVAHCPITCKINKRLGSTMCCTLCL